MNRQKARRLAILLVALLSWSATVQPARALLPEIVVGVTLLGQAASVLAVLMPQLTALGTSMVAVAKSGHDIADTSSRILQMVFGTPQKKATETKAKPASKEPIKIEPFVVPVITGPKDSPAAVPAATVPSDGSLDGALPSLVKAFHAEKSNASRVVTPGQVDDSYADLAERLTGRLLEAANNGDKASISRFVAAVKALPPDDQAAVEPILAATQRGGKFGALHAESGNLESVSAYGELHKLSGHKSPPAR